MGLESLVSQLKAVPSSGTGNAKVSAAPKLAGEPKLPPETAARTEAAPPVFAPMDERQLAQWELMTDQLLSGDHSRPWHVRHARKLIGGAAVLVAASLAFFSYYAWRLPTQRAVPAAPLPVTAVPQNAPVPAAAAAPALSAVSRCRAGPRYRPGPICRAGFPHRGACRRAGRGRAQGAHQPRGSSRRSSPAAVDGPARSGRHPYTARRARACARGSGAAPAVAAPAVAAPPVAAPGDCPDAIVALGLCASPARKGMK